ncbi:MULTISPECIES: hypothetical protein [Rhodococcus]|uniref:hypothetical protein n=1 Tax=Rhodococcus TaxID=1827 RepID=UPI001F230E3E|nr:MULTISPECIES: hypothetical protein [Rhodococcus]MCF8786126.1 hypothetical protein [Rhodococcus ruber]UTM40294.1 hypothetical protein MX572_25645 [Rhodococcus pyridinivorans]WAL49741.1 hypothetical protein OQN32_27400 [Rhodococcus pyridinivorans]
MTKFATTCFSAAAMVVLATTLSACGDEGTPSAQEDTAAFVNIVTPTTTATPIDVESVRDSVRTAGNNLVTSAGWFDCYQQTPTSCTGQEPVEPKDNDAFDDLYDSYSATCQELISRSNFRLDMAERVRPWIVDDDADQIIANIDEQERTATTTVNQTDGSSIVLHFDLKDPWGIAPQCNEDGTLHIEMN